MVPTTKLGKEGLVVSKEGLGCMGMSQSYGQADEAESIATIHQAIDSGVFFLDTANVYGDGHNEQLVGKAIANRRDQVVIATKFSLSRNPKTNEIEIDGRPENVITSCEQSLKRLGVDYIDLYYQHRVDPKVPIEDTVGAMAELVQQGKVRYLGLSEASAQSLQRAVKVHPISALQSEWSLWTRDLEDEIVPLARQLGIGIVPYSPLGRGFLSGSIKSPDDFDDDDFRKNNPRFQGENFKRNLDLVEKVKQMANEKKCTPAQLALAWVMAQGQDVVPIPGTKRRSYLEQNIKALDVELTSQDLAQLDKIAPKGIAAGSRYPQENYSYGDSPQKS